MLNKSATCSHLLNARLWFRRVFKLGLWLTACFLALLIAIDFWVSISVRERLYQNLDQLPERYYGVVLGTAKYYSFGVPNLYYKYRLDAAQQLFSTNKIRYLLVSGDNKTASYNEPKVMRNDLMKIGIPKSLIRQDFAGYNTLDSVLRAEQVFHLPPFTLISQKFHCERALFIAKYHHIDAICFAAQHPEGHFRVRLRELFARSFMLFNLLFHTEPETLTNQEVR